MTSQVGDVWESQKGVAPGTPTYGTYGTYPEGGCDGTTSYVSDRARETNKINPPELNPKDMTLWVARPGEPQRDLAQGCCCVYFMWSADMQLLYVGVTNDPGRRFTQHRLRKSWWSQVDHMEVEQYASRRRALDREREAIRGWNPLHNIARPKGARR